MMNRFGSIFFFLFLVSCIQAQELEILKIGIVSEQALSSNEQEGGLSSFERQIEEEINLLMTNRREVIFEKKNSNGPSTEIEAYLTAYYNDASIDIVIAVGALPSAVMAQRSTFPKPSIASLIIDTQLQNVPITTANNSGKENFTYVQSPFSFEKDLKILYEIFPFKNVGVILAPNANKIFPNFADLFQSTTQELNVQVTELVATKDVNGTLNAIPANIDAIYAFPLFDEFGDAEYKAFFEGLKAKKIPSVGLLGESMVTQGALVGYQSEQNLAKIPRRIAIDVSKVVAGINASELPVLINTFSETVLINMETVRNVGTYPNWDIVSEAVLLFEEAPDIERKLSLETVIMESLSQNLTLKIAEKNPLLAQKEVALAKTELLPQLDVNSSLVLLDPTTANNSFGTKGRLNWMAGSSLSQLVYAEPVLANITIQKLLQEGEEYGLQAVQLDVVLDAAAAALSVLQAKSFLDIQAANVSVTKRNLDIAKAKDAVGYSGATDLNRWISELALGKIELNQAQSQYQQAKYALNQLLNHSIKDDFQLEDIAFDNSLLMVNDDRLINQINDEKALEKLGDFLVSEAMMKLPELKQIDAGLAAQKRLLVSQKRAFYLPSVALSGGLDHTIKRWNVTTTGGAPIPSLDPTWNVGLGLQYPIFQGGKRRYDQEKTEVNILQIQNQRSDTRNQLELRVRAALQTASASYFSVLQYAKATTAADKNFEIMQDSYAQGLASITSLVDAQNAKVQTALGEVNAGYQFILDFLEVERSIGHYYLLSTPADRTAFFDRMMQYLASGN